MTPHPPPHYCCSVLLHAHMQDYMTCAAITNVWVKHPHNFSHPDYHLVPEAFITRVLLPQKRWDNVGAFLDSCPGLKPEQKDAYIKQIRQLRHQAEEADLDRIEELPQAEEPNTRELADGIARTAEDRTKPWSQVMSLSGIQHASGHFLWKNAWEW